MKRELFNILFLLPLFLLINTSSSCTKDNGLTKATQTGANTFSCLINGKLFTPKQVLFSPEPLSVSISPDGNRLYISASNGETNTHVTIYVNNIYKGVGTYLLDKSDSNNNGVETYILYSKNEQKFPYYYTYFTGLGSITITRSDNNVVSGTFEFVAQNQENTNDKVTCTKGRFDLKL